MDPDRIWRYVYLASACLLFAWLLFRWFVALREEFRGYGRAEAKRVTEDIRRAELAERVAGDIVRAEPAPGDPDAGRPALTEDELKEAAQRANRRGPQRGQYVQHYKGGLYRVVARPLDEATLTPLVVYASLRRGTEWSRPLDVFLEPVRITLGQGMLARARFLTIVPSSAWLDRERAAGQMGLVCGSCRFRFAAPHDTSADLVICPVCDHQSTWDAAWDRSGGGPPAEDGPGEMTPEQARLFFFAHGNVGRSAEDLASRPPTLGQLEDAVLVAISRGAPAWLAQRAAAVILAGEQTGSPPEPAEAAEDEADDVPPAWLCRLPTCRYRFRGGDDCDDQRVLPCPVCGGPAESDPAGPRVRQGEIVAMTPEQAMRFFARHARSSQFLNRALSELVAEAVQYGQPARLAEVAANALRGVGVIGLGPRDASPTPSPQPSPDAEPLKLVDDATNPR